MRGRKSKFREGFELGWDWIGTLKLDKKFKEGKLQGDYKKLFKERMKKKRPTRLNKISRQEFDRGFRLGYKKRKEEK